MGKNKKGQVTLLSPAILGLVFAAIVLVFGIIITQSMRDIDTVNDVTRAVINESGAYVNTTGYTLADITYCGVRNIAVTEVWIDVSVSAELLPASNYTLSTTGNLTNASIIPNATMYGDANVSYTLLWGDEACKGANQTVVGLGTFADFWEIIVLAIVITVVIGLLLVVFGGRRER